MSLLFCVDFHPTLVFFLWVLTLLAFYFAFHFFYLHIHLTNKRLEDKVLICH